MRLARAAPSPEVPFAVGQPQRPRLGDAQVQERDGFEVAAEPSVGACVAVARAQQSPCLLDDAVEVTAQPR